MQMHLDFDVDDLNPTEARVLAAGATKYDVQPNDHCRVYTDPAGHPFCLSFCLSTYQALQGKPDSPDAVGSIICPRAAIEDSTEDPHVQSVRILRADPTSLPVP